MKPAGTGILTETVSDKIRAEWNERNSARERALTRSREVIRNSALAIRAIHRHDFDRARQMIERAAQGLAEAVDVLQNHGEVLYAGFVQDAAKEYAEASITLALVNDQPMPAPEELNVSAVAYLNGAGEAVGELRRYLLDELRHGTPNALERCETLLQMMEDIYSVLVTMDYPDAITGGLRRTTDMVRGILEKTRGDLTIAMIQSNLYSRLSRILGEQGAIPPLTAELDLPQE